MTLSFARALPRRHWIALGALLLSFALSCALHSDRPSAVQRWWSERGPVVPHDSFPADCSLCHTEEGWRSIRADFNFDHEKETGVKLEGAHVAAECLRCHNDRGPVSMFATRGCAGCHEDPHRAQLGADCTACHTQLDWRANEKVAMHSRTRFPLIGAHAVTACFRCHPGAQVGNFLGTDIDCATCHQNDLARATSPDHAAQGWTGDCQTCHTPTAWSGGGFVHSTWPLTGTHTQIACDSCHAGGVFAGTPNTCVDCHLVDFQGATDPNHIALNFGTNCRECHNTVHWDQGVFSHAGIVDSCATCHITDYQNTTAPNHTSAGFGQTCEQCHTSGGSWNADFAHTGITSGCVSCHVLDYQNTSTPNHLSAGYGQSCEDCHQTNTWGFSHAGITTNCVDCHLGDYQNTTAPNHTSAGFGQTCEQCHTAGGSWNSNFSHAGISSGCVSCHALDYQNTSAPNHVSAGYGQSCEDCHQTNTWNFAHAGITSNCVDCHLTNYQATTQPNHATAGFGQTCEQCHTTLNWNANFSHAGITNGCVTCHLTDYQGATNPNHVAGNIPQTCETCHTTSAWPIANFSHAGISSNCSACHMSNYQTAVDPNHLGANFGTTCEQCHTSTSNWDLAHFSHSFPITTGKHKNFNCTSCHLVPTNYQAFSCTHCHAHRQSEMNSEHNGETGYVWLSSACYSCHPDGQADD